LERAGTSSQAKRVAVLERAPSAGLVLGAIASVQFGSALAATLFARIGPAGAVTLRLAAAAVILAALWPPSTRGRTRGELRLAIIFGLVLAGMNLSFYEALHRIPLGIAVAIEFVGPLGVAIIGSRRPLDLVWAALATLGILALARGRTHGLDGVGIALALLAGVLWGTYIVVNARVGRAFAGASGLAFAMCAGALALLPVGIAGAGSRLLEPRSLFPGIAVGILSSVIPYSFELEALRRIRTSVFGVLMSLEPAVAALAGFIVLGQGMTARMIAGIALVSIASVGASRRAAPAVGGA
jgi:inner membrane transporter RhtA